MAIPAEYLAPKPRLRGWLHAAAAPVALAGTVVLWRSSAAGAGRLSALIFGLALVGLYTTSATYHVPPWSARVKELLGRCDGAMIQITIVGTFTPIAFHALDGAWRTWSLVIGWAVALAAVAVVASPYRGPRWLNTASYIAVGWLTVVPLVKIVTALPWEGSGLIILGGVLYTIGAVVYGTRRPNPFPRWFGFHEIFHIFVVAASCAHYVAIWRYVLPIG